MSIVDKIIGWLVDTMMILFLLLLIIIMATAIIEILSILVGD